MSCLIDYPAANGYGAVDGSNYLVSVCGRWTRPATWDPTERCRIYGKVYAAGDPLDVGLPLDAVEGNLWPYDTASGGDFDFNSSLLPNAAAGLINQIKVWLVNIDTGAYQADSHDFDGCVYGDPGCPDPDCLNPPSERTSCDRAIDQPAPEEYRVGPDLRAMSLIGEATQGWKPGELKSHGVKLDYSLSLSTPSRAVWVSGDSKDGPALRMEVTRTACGLTATLYLLQLSKRGVEPAKRWRSTKFNLASGGVLHAIDACCREIDGTILVSVPDAKKQVRPK